MATKLDTINEQLDELLVHQLQLIQDYITVTIEGDTHQKTGFINLAKARYIQGFHTVSQNCLFSQESEEERPALLTVTPESASLELESLKDKDDKITYQRPVLSVNSDKGLESQLNKQFGFLSSSTLKHAKANFRSCLEKSIERAIIVNQSFALQKQYKKLMKEKLNIENTVPAS